MDSDNNLNAAKDRQQFISFCKIMSTAVAYKTLVSLFEGPKSVADICLENKTPVSSTYKVVKSLQQIGLVSVHDILIDEHGKRVTIYKSKVKSLGINIGKRGIKMEFSSKDDDDNESNMTRRTDNRTVSKVMDSNHETRTESQLVR